MQEELLEEISELKRTVLEKEEIISMISQLIAYRKQRNLYTGYGERLRI